MLEELYKRQSIRKYLSKEVETEKIESLLQAAMNAPTAMNRQSWKFMVIKNREALDSMIELQPYTGMMKGASCAIMVMGDTLITEPSEYLYVEAGAAIENMLIEAVHLELGACWCAIGPKTERIDAFRNYYQIADHLIPIAVVAIGYPDEVKEIQDRYDPNKVTWFR